jgi:hypothetical protein
MGNSSKISKTGKPALSDKEIDLIFRKLEPYLRVGLSLHAAALKADVPKSTAYDLYAENEQFAEIIDATKQYFTVTVNDAIALELKEITDKQSIDVPISVDDRRFLQWLALNNKQMREFYGNSPQEIKKEETKKFPDDAKSIVTILKSYEAVRNNMLKQYGEDFFNKPD